MISQSLMTKIRDDLDRWETPVLWMYLDSEGYVTVGCGTMLPDGDSARNLPFFHEKTMQRASPADIEAAWKQLHSGAPAQKGAAAASKFSSRHYRSQTDLRITLAVSSSLRDRHVEADYQQLKLIYAGFDALPENAQLALFDMIYNVGAGHPKDRHHRATGLRRFALMNAAINKADWSAAAQYCSRHGIPDQRNQMTASLFSSCAGKAKMNEAPAHHP